MRKIALLCALLFCCNTTFAQHMDFDGISFENSLETFNEELNNRGFSLVEDGDDDVLFYRGLYKDVYISIFIRYTPLSKKVYEISILYDKRYNDWFKKYIEKEYNVKPVESHLNARLYPTASYSDFVYDISNTGVIVLHNDCGHINVVDYEFDLLWKAECWYPGTIKKRDLKRWQRKYNNPLFYDENPAVRLRK